MLSLSIGFFMLFNTNRTVLNAYADISGVSGEVICLTGSQGYQPYNYFIDENGDSTLSAADGTVSAQYYNESGELTQSIMQFQVIQVCLKQKQAVDMQN